MEGKTIPKSNLNTQFFFNVMQERMLAVKDILVIGDGSEVALMTTALSKRLIIHQTSLFY